MTLDQEQQTGWNRADRRLRSRHRRPRVDPCSGGCALTVPVFMFDADSNPKKHLGTEAVNRCS